MKREFDLAQPTRRDALRLLGVGALAATAGARATAAALFGAKTPAAGQIPRGALIRTILKDLPPDALGNGYILFHEHMSFGSVFFEKMRPRNAPPPTTPRAPSFLEDPQKVIDEVKATGKDGVSCIVDGGHADMGTSYADLKTIAEQSGVHIVASGGYYLELTYPPEIASESEAQLVERLARDAAEYRWGAFGEIGSSPEMTENERKVFRVMAKAQQRTSLPMFTHTSHASCKACAIEQLNILESNGADLRHVVIGHLSDIKDDPRAETHKEIARRGAFLGFDTVGHQLGPADSIKVAMIKEVLEAGYEDHILLSADFAADRETKATGGAGYSTVPTVFLPKLRYAGVKDATLHKIMVENPKRFLAFVPRKLT